jgi:hypothetical protein
MRRPRHDLLRLHPRTPRPTLRADPDCDFTDLVNDYLLLARKRDQ